MKKINPHVRIIAMSGLVTSEFCLDATNHDILGFLPKPFTTKDLLKALHAVAKD